MNKPREETDIELLRKDLAVAEKVISDKNETIKDSAKRLMEANKRAYSYNQTLQMLQRDSSTSPVVRAYIELVLQKMFDE
jgi:hypothetical protein